MHVQAPKSPNTKFYNGAIAIPCATTSVRYRTLAAAAGIDRLRVKILMNHSIDGDVTDSYTNVPALFASLLDAQETVSTFINSGLAAKRKSTGAK